MTDEAMKYCTFCEKIRDDHLDQCPVCTGKLETRGPDETISSMPSSSATVEEPADEDTASSSPTGKLSDTHLAFGPEETPPTTEGLADKHAADWKLPSTEVDNESKPPHEPEADKGVFRHVDPFGDGTGDAYTEDGTTDEAGTTEENAGFGGKAAEFRSKDPGVGSQSSMDGEVDEAERKLLKVIGRVNQHLSRGFDLYGLVGHPGSGKTHCLKALTYLLKRLGVDSGKARVQFSEVPSPDPSLRTVFDFAYTGPAQERWVFVDAGGELYQRIHENRWDTVTDEMTALARWLQSCKGLFLFLHLNEHHFSRSGLDDGLWLDDEEYVNVRKRAKAAQEELAFFKSFLLFLRALKLEQGGIRKLIQRCRESKSLEEVLVDYHRKAPLLDIPVMFFFSKADSFLKQGFEITPGVQFAPRQMTTSTAAFVARHLPGLFADVASQVQRFKFDFLQSYEELEDGRDFNGNPVQLTVWEADQETALSIGLLAGLEFILRNQTRRGRWWQGPGISTLRALALHRRFNPGQWKDVPLSLRYIELSKGSES